MTLEADARRCVGWSAMGEIEHAGTSKAMPAINDDKPAIRTSDEGAEVAGEIVAEPTNRVTSPAGADKVAAERGMPPIRKPTQQGMPAFRKR
jgi:hypothetical protein